MALLLMVMLLRFIGSVTEAIHVPYIGPEHMMLLLPLKNHIHGIQKRMKKKPNTL